MRHYNYIIYKKWLMLFICGLVFMQFSCKKFVDVAPPVNQINTKFVFSNDQTATSAVLGIYSTIMQQNENFLNGVHSVYSGLSADEFVTTSPNPDPDAFANNALLPNNTVVTSNFWQSAYNTIYQANSCIEGLNSSTGVTASTKNQLLGEAKFMRALSYFYMVNTFGDVPLILSTDYITNRSLGRTDSKLIYSQITTDLQDAEKELSAGYPNGVPTRPNQLAASALLARVYLYQSKWAEAEAESTLVINSGKYQMATDLNSVFLINSPEAILQLAAEQKLFNTSEGNSFNPQFSFLNPRYTLNNTLLNAFETGDARKDNWLKTKVTSTATYTYPYKYKKGLDFSGAPATEYNMVLRYAEQFLIRAEARARQGNDLNGAASDLNQVRTRASLTPVTPSTQNDLLTQIAHENQIEFFAEWGHRWFDLKRTGTADAVLGAEKSGWKSSAQLYPIPLAEIQVNAHLTQNPGY